MLQENCQGNGDQMATSILFRKEETGETEEECAIYKGAAKLMNYSPRANSTLERPDHN